LIFLYYVTLDGVHTAAVALHVPNKEDFEEAIMLEAKQATSRMRSLVSSGVGVPSVSTTRRIRAQQTG